MRTDHRRGHLNFSRPNSGVKDLAQQRNGSSIKTNYIVGFPNEITIDVDNIICPALLDTGATISTISEEFYTQSFSHIYLHPVSEALHIECADGQVMPYLGYICTSITPYGMPIDSFHGCSFLVVPTSQSEYLFVLKKHHFKTD